MISWLFSSPSPIHYLLSWILYLLLLVLTTPLTLFRYTLAILFYLSLLQALYTSITWVHMGCKWIASLRATTPPPSLTSSPPPFPSSPPPLPSSPPPLSYSTQTTVVLQDDSEDEQSQEEDSVFSRGSFEWSHRSSDFASEYENIQVRFVFRHEEGISLFINEAKLSPGS